MNYLVHWELHFSQKLTCLAYLNLRTIFSNNFTHILFRKIHVVPATQRIMTKLRNTFIYNCGSIWESLHRNGAKILKNSAIMDNVFGRRSWWHIYTHPLELLVNDISYFKVYICIIRIIVLLTTSCFYEISLVKEVCLCRKTSLIYFHLKLTTIFSLQINIFYLQINTRNNFAVNHFYWICCSLVLAI